MLALCLMLLGTYYAQNYAGTTHTYNTVSCAFMLRLYRCAMCVMTIVTVSQGEYACWWWVIFTK